MYINSWQHGICGNIDAIPLHLHIVSLHRQHHAVDIDERLGLHKWCKIPATQRARAQLEVLDLTRTSRVCTILNLASHSPAQACANDQYGGSGKWPTRYSHCFKCSKTSFGVLKGFRAILESQCLSEILFSISGMNLVDPVMILSPGVDGDLSPSQWSHSQA